MTDHSDAVDLPCHLCGYDLRAHSREEPAGPAGPAGPGGEEPEAERQVAADVKCPECGASVAESRRLAAIPLRPAWGDSDPRWRRRMLAGTWILVLVPLMDACVTFGLAPHVPIPNVFGFPGTLTLDETLLAWTGVYHPLVFCIGVVLLFSRERGRRAARFDWTRRWGILCSYVVMLLSAVQVLFLCALVLVGIAAVFQDMPLRYQPRVTRAFVEMSAGYLRYGAYPSDNSAVVLVAFSSVAILLACIPLFEALCSTGGRRRRQGAGDAGDAGGAQGAGGPQGAGRARRVAAILLVPLALFALVHLAQAVRYLLGISSIFAAPGLYRYAVYFWPAGLVNYIANPSGAMFPPGTAPTLGDFLVETMKWCIVLAIALWLTIAQLAAWRRGKKAKQHEQAE